MDFLETKLNMNSNQPHGRIVCETYKVNEVLEVKCWTIFRIEGSFSIQLKRFYTDIDLVSKVVGNEIIVRIRTYKYSGCGFEIDRDLNSTINIKNKFFGL